MVKGAFDGAILSREPNNLLNKHSYKSSGLVDVNTVGLEARKEGGMILSVTKDQPRASKKPSGRVSVVVNRSWRKDFDTVARITSKTRPDLVHNVKKRFGRLSQVQYKKDKPRVLFKRAPNKRRDSNVVSVRRGRKLRGPASSRKNTLYRG